MGWGYRKSFSSGSFKVTLSKSGITTSFGVKGARITSGSRGTYVTIGSKGFFYRQRIDTPKSKSEYRHQLDSNSELTPNQTLVTQGDIDQLRSTSSKELLAEIEQKHKLTSFLLVINIIFGVGSLIILLIRIPFLFALWIPIWIALGVWANRQDFQRKHVSLIYSLDDSTTQAFEKMGEGVHQLATSNRMWWIATESAISDKKRNAGATGSINPHSIASRKILPLESAHMSCLRL